MELPHASMALVGGYGRMGVWILDFLSREGLLDQLSVTVTGPRLEAGSKVAQRYGCSFSTDNREAAGSDFIVVCTSLKAAPAVLGELAPHIRKGTVVMDICSVKSNICSAAQRLLPDGTEYISVHPMFGPSVSNLEGQVVVLVPVRNGPFFPRLKAMLESHHARTITTDFQTHDYVLGVVQCLTHFAYIAVGATLKDLDFDLKESRSFSSPVYELMLDMIGRILSGDPMMYAEIQMSNPYSARIEELFLENAARLKAAVDSRNATDFCRIMVEAAKHYDDLESAFSKSSRAVSALYDELIKIKASVGKQIAVRNELTGAVHLGLLREMTAETITIGDGKRKIALKTSKVTLLPEDEVRRLRAEKYGTVQRDLCFVFGDRADPQTIARMIARSDEELASITPIDVYLGPGIPMGKKSMTFRLAFFGDVDADAAEKRARDLFTSMGATER